MSLTVASDVQKGATLAEAFERGRSDQEFFWHFFLSRIPHAGQLKFITEGEATINALACSNRYGKTTLLAGRHFHRCIYKVGGETRYLDDEGRLDLDRFLKLRYNTVHCSGEWEQAAEVWEDAHRLIKENQPLQAFVKNAPKSLPPHIDFINGAKWRFRTLGANGSGVDGKSFYYISIDEAGWIQNLETMMANVLRVRVADVRGIIDIVGTFKPGISIDFYKIAVRASAYTGAGLALDHRTTDEDEAGDDLDAAIRKYARELGFDLEGELEKLRQREDV